MTNHNNIEIVSEIQEYTLSVEIMSYEKVDLRKTCICNAEKFNI